MLQGKPQNLGKLNKKIDERQKVVSSGGGSYTPPIPQSDVTNLVSDLALKAPLASPALTGSPTGPTPAVDDNDTSLATTAFVLGQAGTANPIIDGTAAPGVSPRYSRQDHVHPTDTSRMAATTTLNNVPVPTGAVNFNGQQATSLLIENRTSDPGSPATGQIWLRTDL